MDPPCAPPPAPPLPDAPAMMPAGLGKTKRSTPTPAAPAPPPPAPLPPEQADVQRGWLPLTKEKKPTCLVASKTMATATSVDITGHISWDKASGYRRSSEGASGVFFVETPEGLAVVKGCEGIPQEVFASELANRVDIAVPRMRVLQFTNVEWSQAIHTIVKLASQVSEVDKVTVRKQLDRAFLIVMEFIPGSDLERMGPTARPIFTGPDAAARFRELGLLICLDIVLNNWDRCPVLWDNEGNYRNVFLQRVNSEEEAEAQWKIVGVDQSITPLKRELYAAGHDKYMARVAAFAKQIVAKPDEEAPEIQKLRESLAMCIGLELSSEQMIQVQYGILEGMKRFVQLTSEDLEGLKQKVKRMVVVDWESVWERGVDQIHLPMIETILQIFRDALQQEQQPQEQQKEKEQHNHDS